MRAEFRFYVGGGVMLWEGLKHGRYGVVACMGKREIFRQDPLVDVVKPTVGKTGSIEKVEAVEKAHRPGDVLELSIKGSAFMPNVISSLGIQVLPKDMGVSTFTYVSPGLIQAMLHIPLDAPVGVYEVHVLSNGKV